MSLEPLKKQAALQALAHVENGMLLGLGTGSTARHFIDALGEKVRTGELQNIRAVSTSKASEAQAHDYGIDIIELRAQTLDLAVDGMDEVDEQLNVIKGLGGALTREKIVEACADVFILIGDETKLVSYLGEKQPIPVEVVQFGWQATQKRLANLGLEPQRRADGDPFVTDNGNFILHCATSEARDVYALANDIAAIPGVVEHGLFLDMAQKAYVATQEGVTVLDKAEAKK